MRKTARSPVPTPDDDHPKSTHDRKAPGLNEAAFAEHTRKAQAVCQFGCASDGVPEITLEGSLAT